MSTSSCSAFLRNWKAAIAISRLDFFHILGAPLLGGKWGAAEGDWAITKKRCGFARQILQRRVSTVVICERVSSLCFSLLFAFRVLRDQAILQVALKSAENQTVAWPFSKSTSCIGGFLANEFLSIMWNECISADTGLLFAYFMCRMCAAFV